jgi:hypothetical protein
MRIIHLQIDVTIPTATTEEEVKEAINAALDEPPCNWGEWVVGAARAVTAQESKAELSNAPGGSGIKPATTDTYSQESLERAYEMYEAGCTHFAVVQATGVDRQTAEWVSSRQLAGLGLPSAASEQV